MLGFLSRTLHKPKTLPGFPLALRERICKGAREDSQYIRVWEQVKERKGPVMKILRFQEPYKA